jgi:hypothetical protein
MRSATYHLSISATRANALFASALQRSEEPSAAQVRRAIAAAIRAFGARGCAAQVAQAYGEHPETAVQRMRWARAVVQGDGEVGGVFGPARPGPAPTGPGQRIRSGSHSASRERTSPGTCRAA